MVYCTQRLAKAIPLLAVCVMNSGCALFGSRAVHTLELFHDPETTGRVQLVKETQVDALRGGPYYNYAKLSLRIVSTDGVVLDHIVSLRETSPSPELGSEIEIRTDHSHRRFWLVDRRTRQVVSAVDSNNWTISACKKAPPAWARPSGGKVIDPINHQEMHQYKE